jgi:iron complex outermembrane recepter protein
MLRIFVRSRATLSLLLTVLGAVPAVASAADEPTAMLESIVVTAQKREENLQDVPVAVTALTSQTLEEMRFENLSNLSAVAPGVSDRHSPGGNEAPNLTMRGVFGSGTFASDPGISLYIDGIYLSSTLGAEVDLADIERIEILRGPQGTLFGRNALAGAVNVITKEPSGSFAVHQQLSFGNFKEIRSKTSVDLPTWNDFSASVTFLHDQEQGDVNNLGAGTAWNWGPATDGKYGVRISPETLGAHDTNAVSLGIKFENDSGFKAVYRGNYSHKIFTPDATGLLTFNTGPGANAFLGGLFGGLQAGQNPALRTPLSATRPESVNNGYTTPGLDQEQSHSLTMTLPVNDYLSFKNLLAYRTVHVDSSDQLDGEGGLLAAPGIPILPISNATQSDQRSVQEELQANIDTTWVKSTIGSMYYQSRTIEGGFPNSLNAPFGSGLFPGVPAFVNFVAPTVPGALDDNVRLNSYAIYSQNDVHILPKLDLVLGGRYSKDQRGGLDNSPTPGGPGVSVDYDKTTPTYLGGLNYKLTEDIFAYAKFSTAYITGGRLANVPFAPETAKSYEVGVKSDLLDHKLRVNVAIYSAQYTNVQVLTGPQVGCANVPGVALTAGQCVISGGDERASGAEAEVTYVPVAGLTLAANTAYTHVKISNVPASLLAPDGNYVLPFLPDWTASLSAQYRGSDLEVIHGAHVTGRFGADYVSRAYGSTPNSVVSVADAAAIPARTIFDGRLGLGGFQLAGAETEVALFVKNLTNNKSITYDFNAAASIPVNYQKAREFGIDLLANF